MAVPNGVVDMARILAIIHFVVGALLIIFGIVDAVITYIPLLVLPVACGIWVSFASLSKFRFSINSRYTQTKRSPYRSRFSHSRLPARSLL